MCVVEVAEVVEVVICRGFEIYFFWRKQKDMCAVEVLEVAEVVICKGLPTATTAITPAHIPSEG